MGLGVLLRPSRAPFLGFHQPLCFLFTLLGSGSRLWGAPKHWIGPEPVALKRDPRRQFGITALDGGLNRLRGFDRNRSCRSWNRRGRNGHRGCVSRWDRAATDAAQSLDLGQALLFLVDAHGDELDHRLGNAQTAL